MSWIEKIQTDFTIICGDGKSYAPKWVNASKAVDFNISVFEFINVAGSLVDRRLPKGRRFAIELIFDGEDHLDVAESFELSANDPRPWTVQHPFYGTLLVQPSELVFNDGDLNVTTITGMLSETIRKEDVTISAPSAPDKIIADAGYTNSLLAQTCANDITTVGTVETRSLLASTSGIYGNISKQIKTNTDAAIFFNAYNKVNGIINSGFYETIDILNAFHDFVSLPYQFADTLQNRLRMFVDQYNLLNKTLSGIPTRQSKKLYEHNAGLTITGLILASVTNIGNAYLNADDVLSVIGLILGTYNGYMGMLDTLQSNDGGEVDSYIPDAGAITALSQLVGYALGSLVDIAANSKQKRTFYLQEDSNVVLVAKKVYGLLSDDSTIQTLIRNNNIGLNEILGLRKGRKIIYYV